MSMKKTVSLLLAFVMFFSCVSFNASASDNEENILSSVADVLQEAVGKFVNFFAKCFNIILKNFIEV